MDVSAKTDYKEWKKKRSRMYITFCILNTSLGAQYSIIMPSLWFYVDNIIKPSNTKLHYGIILAFYQVSSVLSNLFITPYAEKNSKLTFNNAGANQPISTYFNLFSKNNFVFLVSKSD